MARKKVEFSKNPLLSGPSLVSRTAGGSPYRELQLSEIDVDPEQPRRIFDSQSLAELAASIKEHGVLSPILVRLEEGGVYRLVAGERRFRASKLAGQDTIPAVVLSEKDDDDTLAKQLIENIQREDLTPMERALAVGQLKENHNWSIREIAKRLGVSKALVQRSLDVLALPDELQTVLINGASESKVLLIAGVEDLELREALIEKVDELTRAQIEQAIKTGSLEVYHGGTPEMDSEDKKAKSNSKSSKSSVSADDQRIIRELQETLGTKVHIARKKPGAEQGKITLEFYSGQDLEEIYNRLMAS